MIETMNLLPFRRLLPALCSACLGLALLLLPLPAAAAYGLPSLPYPAEALAPAIDATTMTIHHDRHHGAYVVNLNAQIQAHPELDTLPLEALQGRISRYPVAVRNNGGGHYNHSLFWSVMAPVGKGGVPSAALEAAITAAFGSDAVMQQRFTEAATGRFGSGWAWLIRRPDGSLAITSTANQDNPLMDVAGIERGTPLLGLDVWEHAYYLTYQNRRPDYIKAWWPLVNWNEVSRRFDAASKGES